MKKFLITGSLALFALTTIGQGVSRAADLTAMRISILKQINNYRIQNGHSVLRASAPLMALAESYAYLEANKDQMGHNLDGLDAGQRMNRINYQFTAWGENVGYQYGSGDLATVMVQGWLNSPPHHANIVNDSFTETGIGVAQSNSGKYYFCQVFAHPVHPSRTWRQTQIGTSVGLNGLGLSPKRYGDRASLFRKWASK